MVERGSLISKVVLSNQMIQLKQIRCLPVIRGIRLNRHLELIKINKRISVVSSTQGINVDSTFESQIFMSESGTAPKKQGTEQNTNALEKLIKLDKKNSQVNVYDRTTKYRFSVRKGTYLSLALPYYITADG